MKKKVSIFITTKNRLAELKETLQHCEPYIKDPKVEFLICDDGSTDGTFDFVTQQYPTINLIRNIQSQGLIYSRNRLLERVTAPVAVCLDDDAHLITPDALDKTLDYFDKHPQCGVIAYRIYWGKQLPVNTQSYEKPERVQGFVGCGHVWRMSAWKAIPPYPEWFEFYGEEEFAARHLFLKNIEIHYLPGVLVQHRVEVKSRKNQPDYIWRLRRSLRSGWYLYFIFLPKRYIPRKLAYSIWMQLKLKVFKGDFMALTAIILALMDSILNCRKVLRSTNRFSENEWKEFLNLNETKIYFASIKNSKKKYL